MFTVSMIDFFISKIKNGVLLNKIIFILFCASALIVPPLIVFQEKETIHNLYLVWLCYFLGLSFGAYHFFTIYLKVNKRLIKWIEIGETKMCFVTLDNSRIECLLNEISLKRKEDFAINKFYHQTWGLAGTINNEDNETFRIFLKKRKFYLKAGLFENRELLYDFINKKVQE